MGYKIGIFLIIKTLECNDWNQHASDTVHWPFVRETTGHRRILLTEMMPSFDVSLPEQAVNGRIAGDLRHH